MAASLLAADNRPANRSAEVSLAPANVSTNDAVQQEFQELMEADNAAQAEVDEWIRGNQKFAEKGDGTPPALLRDRILKRFEPVRKSYEDFIERHPDHAGVRVAFASLLNDLQEDESARQQLEKALTLDTNNPAIYNNLAEMYVHDGPVLKGFEFYTKAIQLNPNEPLYYHNFGNVVYLFRKDAKEFYGINEQQVFDKAFELYSNAMRLDPTNFVLATDVAESYYGARPMRIEEALKAWTNAFRLARDEIEREGVKIHFARVHWYAGHFTEARNYLKAVTNNMYTNLKTQLAHSIDVKEAKAAGTNAATAASSAKP